MRKKKNNIGKDKNSCGNKREEIGLDEDERKELAFEKNGEK